MRNSSVVGNMPMGREYSYDQLLRLYHQACASCDTVMLSLQIAADRQGVSEIHPLQGSSG